MEIVSGCASKLGELLVGATIKQARYMFCFNSIVKEFEVKENDLKEAKDDIDEKVEEERRKHLAIVVEKEVEKWLADVVKEMADVHNLKAKIDEKKSCLNGWCPNWGCRYWLGRKASKKSRKLSDLQDRGKFSTVARPRPLKLERELSIPSCFSSSYETTKSACNQIIEALEKESTKMVGLYGLGGVGKTTLANFVGKQLRQQNIFDKVGIATVSRDPNIINVQGELVKSLGWELKEKEEKDRADRLHLMFSESKSSKILIIIDDLWTELDLETVGIPVGDRDNCCKILLTTRLQPVCDRMGCDRDTQIQLGVLKREEGLDLLRKHAGIDVDDSTLIDVSKQVADECKGLPLAIKAVGSALRGRNVDEWNVALDKLQNAKLNKIEGIDKDSQGVYGCLKFSYDYLNGEDSQLCFLLCSLFPEDYEIDLEDLIGYGVGLVWYQAESIEKARSLLRGAIKGLKAASLLLDTGNDRSVKMHDVVRDVAIWIGSVVEKKFFSKTGIRLAERAVEEGLEQYRGISLVGNKKEKLPCNLLCHNLHILRLENTVYKYKLQVPEYFFEEMPALKVFTIIGGALSLKSLQFLTKLQVLQLIRCDVSDASFLGKLKRLELLFFQSSPIEIPEELWDEFSRLKLLYIDVGSISPIMIKKFPQLEEFYGRIKKWEVEGTSSEESYARPVELNSQPDGSVVCLPKDFTFPKLQRYCIIEDERGFVEIDREIRSLIIENAHREATSLVIFSALYQNLEYLHLSRVIGCQNIVPSIDNGGLNKLTYLSAGECKDLEWIMDASQSPHGKSRNHEMLSRLAELDLHDLPELKWIWKAPAQHVISLQTLTELSVRGCKNLTYIFTLSQARSLIKLKSLKVNYCERLECIVKTKFDHNEGEISAGDGNTILELPLLRELRLGGLPKLISFCSENYYSIWPALEKLNLEKCPDLAFDSTELEANLQYLEEKLENLYLSSCSHLHDTIPVLLKRGLKRLEELSICEFKDLECIMDSSQLPHGTSRNPGMLSRLPRLRVMSLPELKWIWKPPAQHVTSLQTLTELSVSDCNKLTYIFTLSQARSLVQLKSLTVGDCEKLEYIVEAKFDLNQGEISVGDGTTVLALPLLRELRLRGLPRLTSFCSENHYSIWPALERIAFMNCPNLTVNSTELEANLQYLEEKLKRLSVRNCSHLRGTFRVLLKHGLKKLEELSIDELGMQALEAIIADGQENKVFPCLKVLRLFDLEELQVFLYHWGPTHIFILQNLTTLRVEGCTKLRHLLSSILARNLLQLEALWIINCLELEQIIAEDHLQPVCFPKLRTIGIYNCPKLKRLFHISVAPSLQKLYALFICGNDELEEVFWHKDGADVMDYNEIVMNELRWLELKDLPNLTNFCPAGYQIPFPSFASIRNCPKLRANSEG